jgi:uncharacterized protein YfbU (UPF0304 family)
MATVTIRLDEGIRNKLESVAQARGVTLSDLLRDQIDGLLGRDIPVRDEVPRSLSFQQRQLLAQQHEILAVLHAGDGDESRRHQLMAEVLREGYTGEYDSVFGAMQSEMAMSECKLLWDILDMFCVLGASIDRLSADDRGALGDDNEGRLRFAGFDLNHSRECRLLAYARHLVDTDRWSEIEPRLSEIGDNGNSHSQCLPSYERMLAVYTPIWAKSAVGARGYTIEARLLTLEELKQVAAAWAWPR